MSENKKLDVTATQMGTGIRKDTGKVAMLYCPETAIAAIAAVLMLNSQEYLGKYPQNNFRGGMPWSKVLNPLKRHVSRFSSGEDIDSESGLPHIWHILANAAILCEYEFTYKEGDDRYKGKQASLEDVQKIVTEILKARNEK